MNLIFPKYLTREIAKNAVFFVSQSVYQQNSPLASLITTRGCHIVVLVPAISDELDRTHYCLDDMSRAFILHEESILKDGWKHAYDEIARSKAVQLWDDRAEKPHLLFGGDTPYWGGVKRDGIVVACSGFYPWIDKVVSGMIADTIIGLARDAYERERAENLDADFVE